MTSPVPTLRAAKQVRSAVPNVAVGALLGGREGDRQHRLGAIQRLDLRLLVDREHDRTTGRGEVEADHIGDFLRERGVPGNLEGAVTVRLQLFLAPEPRDAMPGHGDVLGPLQVLRQLARRPVRKSGAGRRRHSRQSNYPRPNPRRYLFPGPTWTIAFQPGQPALGITDLPAVHGRQRHPEQLGNVLAPPPLARPHHDPGPRGQIRGHIPAIRQLPQLGGLFHGKLHTSTNETHKVT
jgi:hypothetical protein